ncbi:hypothetical protein HZH68_016151 [Vespula germanica]|uniref:PiggyBac transposable element-derived protein domain-containing protein n=1 Tax=Vespula germanica TaxID=30212 RepID=A0A834J3B0_VESGE|nr:hypothetical protein HZH68_016151 [Vespula germanica]
MKYKKIPKDYDGDKQKLEKIRNDFMTLILPITTISVRQIIVTPFYYTPSQDCTIDEQQLLSTKCRCSFKVHIKSKPDKYELKIMSLNDASHFSLIITYHHTCIQHISVRATDYTVLSTKPISRTRKVDAKFAKKETVSISRKVKLRRMGNVFPHSSEGDKRNNKPHRLLMSTVHKYKIFTTLQYKDQIFMLREEGNI